MRERADVHAHTDVRFFLSALHMYTCTHTHALAASKLSPQARCGAAERGNTLA